MRKRIILIIANIIIACLLFSSCSLDEPIIDEEPLDVNNESEQIGISDAEYASLFHMWYYDSVEEFYIELRDMIINEQSLVWRLEQEHMESTLTRTHMSEAEMREGIFGHMRNRLLSELTLMFPFYDGEMMSFREESTQKVTLIESGFARRPSIRYRVTDLSIGIMFFDEIFIDDANINGASWLLREISPETMNTHNYEEIIQGLVDLGILGVKYQVVYEKEYQLGDRDVIALVYDSTVRINDLPPGLEIFFVYDDILVTVMGNPDKIDEILPYLTFFEIDFPTNTPLRDTPGREWSTFSTRGG